MNKFFMNYPAFYNIFKKLPLIIFWVDFAICCILGFVDAGIVLTDMEAPVLGWPIIGLVVGFLHAVVHAILVSPIVLIVDSKQKSNEE